LLRKDGQISLSETSPYCIIRLVLAVRNRAKEDRIKWEENGRRGRSPWEEWKECRCRYCAVEMIEILRDDHLQRSKAKSFILN